MKTIIRTNRDDYLNACPIFEISPIFDDADNRLKRLVAEGLAKCYVTEVETGGEKWQEIQQRTEYELNTIIRNGLANSFLTVADLVNWSISQDIPIGPGRGLCVGSVICYVLHITNINPFEYNLLFEPFINPTHISMPPIGIGIDFAYECVGKVIEYIKDKFGADMTAQATSEAMQYNTLTIDLLGFKVLDTIKYTEEQIRSCGEKYANFSIKNIPEDDKATFKLFNEGKTDYVFQFESDGMKDILKQATTKTINDLMALNSLYRPGLPMENILRFIDFKNRNQKGSYPDPCLENILEETYGIVAYHEQIIQIIMRIAGYSLGAADSLRRKMGKRVSELEKEKEVFIADSFTNGFKEDKASNLFDMLVEFATCSFSKSHAVAYTKLSYQTAYLKTNFQEEYEKACNKYYDKIHWGN